MRYKATPGACIIRVAPVARPEAPAFDDMGKPAADPTRSLRVRAWNGSLCPEAAIRCNRSNGLGWWKAVLAYLCLTPQQRRSFYTAASSPGGAASIKNAVRN